MIRSDEAVGTYQVDCAIEDVPPFALPMKLRPVSLRVLKASFVCPFPWIPSPSTQTEEGFFLPKASSAFTDP